MPCRFLRALFLVATLPIASPVAIAQTSSDAINPAAKSIAMAAKLPTYDVVSIHQNKTGESNWSLGTSDDGLSIENATLTDIVQFAYNLDNSDLISGISGHLASARFDIKAKIANRDDAKPTKFTDNELEAMTIPLLADRFHLHVRLVPKTMLVYELVVAKGGPKFKLTEPVTHGSIGLSFSGTDNTLTAKKATMDELSGALSTWAQQHIVIDRTGLKGEGDFTLKWSSDEAQEQGGSNLVFLFTAIQDQLGLKLQPAKLPVDTLVIDHAEMPTEN